MSISMNPNPLPQNPPKTPEGVSNAGKSARLNQVSNLLGSEVVKPASPSLFQRFLILFRLASTSPEQTRHQTAVRQAHETLRELEERLARVEADPGLKPQKVANSLASAKTKIEAMNLPEVETHKNALLAKINQLTKKNQIHFDQMHVHHLYVSSKSPLNVDCQSLDACLASKQAQLDRLAHLELITSKARNTPSIKESEHENEAEESSENIAAELTALRSNAESIKSEISGLKNKISDLRYVIKALPLLLEGGDRLNQPLLSYEELRKLKNILDKRDGLLNASLAELSKTPHNKEIKNKINGLVAILRESSRQQEILIKQELQASPLAIRHQMAQIQNLVGRNTFIPIDQRFALLRAMRDEGLTDTFRNLIKQAAQIKAENMARIQKGVPTDMNAEIHTQFTHHIVKPLTERDKEEMGLDLEHFALLLVAKIGVEINTQHVTDCMSLALAPEISPEAVKNQGLFDGPIERFFGGTKKAQQLSHSLPPFEADLAKQGFIFYEGYAMQHQTRWTQERDASGRLTQIRWQGNYAHQNPDRTFRPVTTKELVLDFKPLGLINEDQEKAVWGLAVEMSKVGRGFPKTIQKVSQIPQEMRCLISSKDASFWSQPAENLDLIKGTMAYALLQQAIVLEYNNLLARLKQPLEIFTQQLTQAILSAMIAEPSPPPAPLTFRQKLADLFSNFSFFSSSSPRIARPLIRLEETALVEPTKPSKNKVPKQRLKGKAIEAKALQILRAELPPKLQAKFAKIGEKAQTKYTNLERQMRDVPLTIEQKSNFLDWLAFREVLEADLQKYRQMYAPPLLKKLEAKLAVLDTIIKKNQDSPFLPTIKTQIEPLRKIITSYATLHATRPPTTIPETVRGSDDTRPVRGKLTRVPKELPPIEESGWEEIQS